MSTFSASPSLQPRCQSPSGLSRPENSPPIKRLAQVKSLEDIQPLSHAVFPGSHCPLFGSLMLIRRIRNASCLVVGTDECTYYAKSSAMAGGDFGTLAERCYSLVLQPTDISFGSGDKLNAAIEEITAQGKPELLFVITTCVVELIGDDFDSLCARAAARLNIAVTVIHTEHYRSENHLAGMEAALTACLPVMREQPPQLAVNILGPRHDNFAKSELAECLNTIGLPINLVLPSDCDITDIVKAPAARLNLVTDRIGLPLAQAMLDRFGLPYIYFDRFVTPRTIENAYLDLFDKILKPETRQRMEEWLNSKKNAARRIAERVTPKLQGYSYIYGNTPLPQLELNAYLTELGLQPKLIQLSQWTTADDTAVNRILAKYNPYVTRNANIAPLRDMYDILRPEFYFGHEYFERLLKKGIVQRAMDRLGQAYGFQLNTQLLLFLEESIEMYQSLVVKGAQNVAD